MPGSAIITDLKRAHDERRSFEQGADALKRRAHSSQNGSDICCSAKRIARVVCLEWGPAPLSESLSGRPVALAAAEIVLLDLVALWDTLETAAGAKLMGWQSEKSAIIAGSTLKTSAGARPPPSARTVSLKRRPVSLTALLSSSPTSSNALKASADSTSAHLYEKYPAAEQAHYSQ